MTLICMTQSSCGLLLSCRSSLPMTVGLQRLLKPSQPFGISPRMLTPAPGVRPPPHGHPALLLFTAAGAVIQAPPGEPKSRSSCVHTPAWGGPPLAAEGTPTLTHPLALAPALALTLTLPLHALLPVCCEVGSSLVRDHSYLSAMDAAR